MTDRQQTSKCKNCGRGGDGMPCGCSRPNYSHWKHDDLTQIIKNVDVRIERERADHLRRIEELQGKVNHFHLLREQRT